MSNSMLGKVDLCLVGAEGVMETGAIVNKVRMCVCICV